MHIRLENIERYVHSYYQTISHPRLFILGIISWFGCVVMTFFHYTGWLYGNSGTWLLWIGSSVFFIFSFMRWKNFSVHIGLRKRLLIVIVLVSLLFLVTHLWNWSSAPWNSYGLFDDAAWDIYFANIYIGHAPFQAAFFDAVGFISRETVFHYYITVFFQLFGYNLVTFNYALLFLGYITVLVTTILIDRLFKNTTVVVCSALILNFFPLQYMHIFMGHRYAITAPLMVLSLYFLYTAFLNASSFRVALSAFFGALCWGSAVMGKQYIYGLVLGGVLLLLSKQQRTLAWKNRHLILTWFLSFFITMTPVYLYIFFHTSTYAIREQELLREFIQTMQEQGVRGVNTYVQQLLEVFISPLTYRRQFLVDYPLIPSAYYVVLIPSLSIVFSKKRYELLVLAVLPIFGSFLSGAYDFRMLIAVPIWVMLMAYGMNFFMYYVRLRIIIFLAVFIGIVSTSTYAWNISKNPHAQYLLPHKDVAVSRLVQDIVLGKKDQSIAMKKNELRVGYSLSSDVYDVFMCPASAYAIMHVFLQAYDDKKILSFCDQGIQQLKTPDEILRDNIHAIVAYKRTEKDLKLIWEVTDTAQLALSTFMHIAPYGVVEDITKTIEGITFSLRILTIPQKDILQFQHEVMSL